MNVIFLRRLGLWTIILTLLLGCILLTGYAVTRDAETGTLLYFYVMLAGLVNIIVFLRLLFSLLSHENKRTILITAAGMAVSYSALLLATYLIC